VSKTLTEWESQEQVPNVPDDWHDIAPGAKYRTLSARQRVGLKGRRGAKVGAFYSWKNLAHIPHMVLAEERCARTLDVHPDVISYEGRPEEIELEVPGLPGLRKYTPSFLVQYRTETVRLQYCRLPDLRTTGNPKSQRRAESQRLLFQAVQEVYRRIGWHWILFTDEDIADVADPETVDEIVANGGRPIDPMLWELLEEHLRKSPDGVPLLECEELIRSRSSFPRGDILARVQERRIWVDLKRPISPTTIIRLVDL